MTFMPILVAAAVACAITAILATLLVVAERYLVNYGEVTIDVNEGSKEITTKGGNNLLLTLKDEGIHLPSACGGRGTCAYCKVRIPEDGGGGPVGPTEDPLLTEKEKKENVRISCQCKVRNDLRIYVPEELLLVREFKARVEHIRQLTHDIKEIRFELLEPDAIEFIPGQYMQLASKPYPKQKEPVFRAYSISSVPSDHQHVELMIRLVPDGTLTTWVFEHLEEGEEVTLTGPYGDFRLSNTQREMVWIAGGSGMAPFWSLLRHMIEHGIHRKTTYFFGAVQRRDLFLVDELRQLAQEHEWFNYVPALSGQDIPESEWDGDRGLITEVVGKHIQDGRDMEGYLCGSPGMIDASIKVLHDKGIDDDRIYYDKFA